MMRRPPSCALFPYTTLFRAGDAVVEAHAEGEQEVGLLDGVVAPGLAVHAHHAEREGMVGGRGSEAEQGAGDGDLAAFGEGDDLVARARVDDAVAGENNRAFRGSDEADGLAHGVRLGAQHGVRTVLAGRGGVEVEGRRALLGVLRYVDKHRTWTPGGGDLEGLPQG